jgi:hypothetical protein
MNTYEQLLENGRTNLRNYMENEENGGPTGIESLEGEFLNQIVELNDYIFTVASTNYPERIPNFQPFFIDSVIDTKLLNKTLDYIQLHYPNRFNFLIQTPAVSNQHRNVTLRVKKEIWELPGSDYLINKEDLNTLLEVQIIHNFELPKEATLEFRQTLSSFIIEDTDPESKMLYLILLEAFRDKSETRR